MRLPTQEIVCGLMLAVLAACGDSPPPAPTETPLGSIALSATNTSLEVGSTQDLTVTVTDATGLRIPGMPVVWVSSDSNVAAVTKTLNGATIRAVNVGNATITATIQGLVTVAAVTVRALAECTAERTITLGVGEVRTLTDAEKKLLCVSSSDDGEYKLVILNTGLPATVSVQGTGVSQVPSLITFSEQSAFPQVQPTTLAMSDIGALQRGALMSRTVSNARLTQRDLHADVQKRPEPKVGDIEMFRADLTISNCSIVRTRPARVVAVTPNIVAYADASVSLFGYTDSQVTRLAAIFDTLVYPLDTLTFGPVSDVDGDGRITVFFTPAVYEAGSLGVFMPMDVQSVTTCPASNERDMVYLGVPTAGYSANVADTTYMMKFAPFLFSHELQHVIYNNVGGNVSDAYNEALSNSSWEMLFYRMTGLSARSNISKPSILASEFYLPLSNLQATYFASLRKPESTSVYIREPNGNTIGAFWRLFRFGVDRVGGDENKTWRALSSAKTLTGVGAALGGFTSVMQANAVSIVTDDYVNGVSSDYAFPSWNFRAALAGLLFPLVERDVSSAATEVRMVQGGSTYFRFGVGKGVSGAVRTTSSASDNSLIHLMLVRAR